jgi:uncharacterized protein YbaP (TraB family)
MHRNIVGNRAHARATSLAPPGRHHLFTRHRKTIGPLAQWLVAWAFSASALAQTAAPPAPAAPAAPQTAAAPADPAELQKRIESIGRRGFLYELVRGNQRLFLYGACGACKAEHFPLNAPLMQALAASASLVVDVNYLGMTPQLQAEIDAMAKLQGTDTLAARLDADSLARLQQALPTVGLDLKTVNQLAPWMVGVVIENRHLAQHGYLLNQNTALYLLGYAKARQMPVFEIEGQAAQFRLLASAPPAAASDLLNQTVRDLLAGRIGKKYELLVEQGWLVGNPAGVQRYNAVEAASAGPWASFYNNQWLAGRNRELAARIDTGAQAQPTQIAFVALPAQRLFGEAGVLALLQGAGFTARDLQSAQGTAAR